MPVSLAELQELEEYVEALRRRLKVLIEDQRDEQERVEKLGEPRPRLSRIP